MLDKEEARQIALEVIGHLAKTSGRTYVIMEGGIIEKPMAWIFPFNSDVYNASRNFRDLVFGIAPIMVHRKTGETRMTPPIFSNESLDRFLAENGAGPDEASGQ
jgi:hypothetical protein